MSSKMVARKEGRVGTSLLGRTSLGTSKVAVARIGFSGGAGRTHGGFGPLEGWRADNHRVKALRSGNIPGTVAASTVDSLKSEQEFSRKFLGISGVVTLQKATSFSDSQDSSAPH